MGSSANGDMFKDLGPIEEFTFSFDVAKTTKKDLGLRVEAYEERVEGLVRKVVINDIPILGHIIHLTRDPKDLTILARALDKLAEVLPTLDEMKEKQTVIDKVFADPSWFIATFADFSSDMSELEKAVEGFGNG